MTLLQQRIGELIEQHGSLRAAARVLECDPGYLSRLQSGEKDDPGAHLLRRLGLRQIITYERVGQQSERPAPAGQAVGAIKVGNLPTMNQDEYPGLGDWWVQLRIGPDGNEVLARVYGDSPEQARERAIALAASQAERPAVKEGDRA